LWVFLWGELALYAGLEVNGILCNFIPLIINGNIFLKIEIYKRQKIHDRKTFNSIVFNRMTFASTLNAILVPKLSWIIISYIFYYSGIPPFNTQQYLANSYGVDVNRYIVILSLTVKFFSKSKLGQGS
jgi:hypothetical protein